MKRNSDAFITDVLLCGGIFSLSIVVGLITVTVFRSSIAPDLPEYAGTEIIDTENSLHLASVTHVTFDVPFTEHLTGLRIESSSPNGVVARRDSVRLTAVGIYSTWEQNIRALWSIKRSGERNLSTIPGCDGVETCTYSVHNDRDFTIYAKAAGENDSKNFMVRAPVTETFSDQLPDWASDSIQSLHGLGIIHGYEDGRYGPADSLTRGQIVTLLARLVTHAHLIEQPTQCKQYATAVDRSHYAYDAICLFYDAGWESGSSFNPNEPVSRGETAAYINRIFGPKLLNALGTTQGAILAEGQIFPDVPTNDWYFFDVGVANAASIMTGNDDGTFGVSNVLNRAEVATVLERVLRRLDDLRIELL